jgi:hypothetical protein
MLAEGIFEQLERRLGEYDLLGHPFYRAWSTGGSISLLCLPSAFRSNDLSKHSKR